MIKVDNEDKIEITGEIVEVLYQTRAVIEALSEVKEFEKIFDKKSKFFDPKASRKEIRELILKIESEATNND